MTNSKQVFSGVIDAQLAEKGWHTQDQYSVHYKYNCSMSSKESGEGVNIRKSFEVSYA
jgi:hypothetical protein